MNLETAFRELRAEWFRCHLESHAPEREWEHSHSQRRREKENGNLLKRYDAQTDAIIRGESATVAPMCSAEMDR